MFIYIYMIYLFTKVAATVDAIAGVTRSARAQTAWGGLTIITIIIIIIIIIIITIM